MPRGCLVTVLGSQGGATDPQSCLSHFPLSSPESPDPLALSFLPPVWVLLSPLPSTSPLLSVARPRHSRSAQPPRLRLRSC